MKDESAGLSGKAIAIGVLVLCAAYFGLFGYWYFCVAGHPFAFPAKVSADKLGNFLAGLFGPPGFLVLAGALVAQVQELGIQRRDLKHSIAEMERSADALAEQEAAMRRQIGLQMVIAGLAELKTLRDRLLLAMGNDFIGIKNLTDSQLEMLIGERLNAHYEDLFKPIFIRADRHVRIVEAADDFMALYTEVAQSADAVEFKIPSPLRRAVVLAKFYLEHGPESGPNQHGNLPFIPLPKEERL